MKIPFLAYSVFAAFILGGCETAHSLGDPIRTIETPYDEKKYKELEDGYFKKAEIWRKDAQAVSQIEVYKLEGKSATLLEQKLLANENASAIVQLTTRKGIYQVHLERPHYEKYVWWVNLVEVYKLPTQDPALNPALEDIKPDYEGKPPPTFPELPSR